jgi:hypothetical protein
MATTAEKTTSIMDGEKYKKTKRALSRERKMTGTAINENEGEGGTLSQVGFIDLRFMFETRKDNKVFLVKLHRQETRRG